MTFKTIRILFCALFLVLAQAAGSTLASAQINIGALAQFKQNQQAALTKQLRASAKAEAKVEKAGKHRKGKDDAPMVVVKPPLIKAQTRSFKGNYSDLRKPNMR